VAEIASPAAVPATSAYARWFNLTVLAVIVTLGAVLRFHGLGEKSVWVDEGVSIELARLDWYNFLRILWRHEGNMALYHLMLRAWLPFGISEAYIRTLSVIFGLATLPAIYTLGRRLFDARVGLIASFLLVVNAYHIRYSQEARSYSLYPLLCVLSSLYFVRFLEEPSRRNRIGHVFTSALAVYAHFFAGLLIVVQWLSLRLLGRKDLHAATRKSWRIFAIAVAPEVLFVLTTGTGVLRWIPRPGLADLRHSAMFLTGNGGLILAVLYLFAIVAAVWRPQVFGHVPRLPWSEWRHCFLVLWIVLPIAFVFLISQLKPFFLPRYFVFTLPALALLAAAGLARIPSRWFLAATLLLFAVLSLKGVSAYYQRDIDIAREDWRGATHYTLAKVQPGDVIVFYQPIGRMPYEYYRSVTPHASDPRVLYPEHGEQVTFRDFYAGRPPDNFLRAISGPYPRVWFVFTYNEINSLPDATTNFVSNWFAQQYRSMQTQRFERIEVRLYSR